MSGSAIQVRGLGKVYPIGRRMVGHRTFRDALSDSLSAPFRKVRRLVGGDAFGASGLDQMMWALRDVSFDVNPGDVVGVVGRNGAGKSTLLKILSRITEPSRGYAEIRGRLGSLLEVGSGFHSELTGRENIYLNGAILGMRKQEIDKKFDEISAFSEIERFIDTPVKHYSSGMAMRLAFGVAAHLETEILLVDEVLAVGDAAFQKKCLGKMGDVAKEGRTVLMVSHNLGAIADLCQTALWFDGGRLRTQGQSSEVIRQYLQSYASSQARWERPSDSPLVEKLNFLSARVLSNGGESVNVVDFDKPFHVEILYRIARPTRGFMVSAILANGQGFTVLESAERDSVETEEELRAPGVYRAVCTVPGSLLKHGIYYLSLSARQRGVELIEQQSEVLAFEVSSANRAGIDTRQGMIVPMLDWSVEYQGGETG